MRTWAERVLIAEANKCGHYGGCGCAAYQGCCTKCPLPECVHRYPLSQARPGNSIRDMQIRALKRGGMPMEELAGRFSMSERNTFRILSGGDT